MSEDSSGSNPFTYIIIPLVAILSIGFIATVLYCRRRRHGRDGSDSNNTSSALDYPYPDWTQDRFMAAEGNLLHYPGGRHLSAFTASASAANSIEAARRANAIRYNHNTIGFGGFGRPARHAHLNNNNNSNSNNDNDRSGPRTITIPQWSFWGGMRSTEGLNELGEAPPPYDTKRKTRSGSNNNLESEAERGNAGIDGGDGAADGDDDNNNNGGGGGNNDDDANRQYGMEFSTRRGRRRRRRNNNNNNNDQEENNSQSRSRSRTPCRCRSQTRESFESAIALQDWLIPRVTDMNAGAMPPEYVARPEPVITAGPRGQPDFPAGSGPSRL